MGNEVIYSKSPHKETRVTWYEDLASSNSKPVSRVKPRAAPPPQELWKQNWGQWPQSCSQELPSKSSSHLIPSSVTCPASPSWDGTRRCRGCAGCTPDPSCPSRAVPASPGTAGDGEHPTTPGERGNHTLAHQLKHTFKHTTFSLRETIPLLSSTSVFSLTVCRKFKSALHFWYVRLSQGRNAPGHEILTTSAMASPLARIFLSEMNSPKRWI